jgi:hypothetical protein
MKTIVTFFIAMFFMATSAFAGHYCDTRGERCWQNDQKVTFHDMEAKIKIIMDSPASDEYKDWLVSSYNEWLGRVNNQCQSWRCIAQSALQENLWLSKEYSKVIRKFNIQPK